MTNTKPQAPSTTCSIPTVGAIKANTRIPCPTCSTQIIWDSPYGYGRWVHTK